MKTMKYEDFRKERLKDPAVKKEYNILQQDFDLAKEVIELRIKNNLTQKDLARLIGTSQPAIARLESGSYRNLTLSFIRRLAEALGAIPEIHLKRREA